MRKFISILVVCFMCLNLSGCAVKDVIKDVEQGIQRDAATNVLKDVSQTAHSKSTEKAAVKVSKSYEKADWWSKFPLIGGFVSDRYKATAYKQTETLKNKLKTDKTYQTAKEAERKKQEKDTTDIIKKYLPILVIVIVAIIVIWLLTKRKPKPVNEVTQQEEVKQIEDVNVKRSGQLKVDYEKLLRECCAKKGLNYDSTLQEYNGNARAAYEAVQFRS